MFTTSLYKLVYTSARRSHCTDAEIENILAACRRNNHERDITGILLHSKQRFLQYLEGDKDTIYRLYERIKTDDRHGGVNLRYFSPIDDRLFPSWQMGYKDLDQEAMIFQTSISLNDQNTFRQLIETNDQSEVEGLRVLKLFFEMA